MAMEKEDKGKTWQKRIKEYIEKYKLNNRKVSVSNMEHFLRPWVTWLDKNDIRLPN